MQTTDIQLTRVGFIDLGIDGQDEHFVLTCPEDDLDPDTAHDWLLERFYRESFVPGGYFCTSVTVVPLPSGNKCIGIVHHRFDV